MADREGLLALAEHGPCVDWQWAVGKVGPRCRRNMTCGAFVPDACPLALRARAQMEEDHG